MEGETSPVVEVAQSQAAQHVAAPAAGAAEAPKSGAVGGAAKENNFAQFVERPVFNVSVALTWTVAVFSIVATLFFWWMSRNLTDALAEKNLEKDTVLQQIASQSDVEKKANDFKLSVNELKTAYASKFNFTPFTVELYKKITKDVVLSNISIGSDGSLSLSGTTKTYRSVADLMMALKSWDNLTNVDLSSAATTAQDGKVSTSFTITAKIDTTKQKTATVSESLEKGNGAVSLEGGNDAKI